MSNETVNFQGRTYIRWPDSKNRNDRVYYKCHVWPDAPRYLHRDVWEDAHGQIPDGWHVHHIDGNPLNNEISNLACIEGKSHVAAHTCELMQDKAFSDRALGALGRAQQAAKAWHRSPEGRAWHSIHSKEIAKNMPIVKKVCDQCGREYTTKGSRKTDRFCSGACKTAWRWQSGKDNITRKCSVCGADFVINRYTKTKTCSRKCRDLLNRNKKG